MQKLYAQKRFCLGGNCTSSYEVNNTKLSNTIPHSLRRHRLLHPPPSAKPLQVKALRLCTGGSHGLAQTCRPGHAANAGHRVAQSAVLPTRFSEPSNRWWLHSMLVSTIQPHIWVTGPQVYGPSCRASSGTNSDSLASANCTAATLCCSCWPDLRRVVVDGGLTVVLQAHLPWQLHQRLAHLQNRALKQFGLQARSAVAQLVGQRAPVTGPGVEYRRRMDWAVKKQTAPPPLRSRKHKLSQAGRVRCSGRQTIQSKLPLSY